MLEHKLQLQDGFSLERSSGMEGRVPTQRKEMTEEMETVRAGLEKAQLHTSSPRAG